jgi:1-acyl-sn-glycerol-3-phosphate acyltransferase
MEVVGLDKMPPTGAFIITPNHVSFLDPPAIGVAMQRECRFLARHSLWRIGWFGRIISSIGALPINREKPDRASVRAALVGLEDGLPLVLFPEGTRSRDGRLGSGETGVVLFVNRARVPVVPAAIIGTEQVLPPDARWPRRGRVRVAFGDPLYFTPDSPRDEVVSGIMRAIAELLTASGKPSTAREDDPASALPS